MSDQDRQKDDQQEETIVTLSGGGRSNRELKTGDIIGDNYKLKELIDRGGMGYVFRAEHLIIGKDYALKILAPDQINETTWQRFQSEGKAIAMLDHVNIVKIYNMGVDGGDCPYYVMDLLNGRSLASYIAGKERFTRDEILDIFIQLCSGFGYAHNRGIIHRDVKPGNIILVDEGGSGRRAKIVDFGIAKLTGANQLREQSQTSTGEIFGSPYYMSPEQCLGAQVDERADIYSLGCTLFEAICGRPPFVGETALATVLMHQNAPTPSLSESSNRPWTAELESVVAKMLMKRPADRYQTMDQVRHDLDRLQQNKAVGALGAEGFRSSIEDQLQEIGKKSGHGYENPERKFFLTGSAAAAAIVILIAAVFLCMRAAQRPPRARVVSGDELIPLKEINDSTNTIASQKRSITAARKLSCIGPITSTIDKRKGTRTIHCPSTSIGTLSWFAGPRMMSCDLDSHDDIRRPAVGDVTVPLDADIFLIVKHSSNRDIWDNPDVLKKVGPNEFAGLRIDSDGGLDLYASEVDLARHATGVVGLIKATAGWRRLHYAQLFDCPVTAEALDALGMHRGLDQLVVRTSDLSGKNLARQPFMQNLKILDLTLVLEPEYIFTALKNSRALRALIMKGSIKASGLSNILGCTNLQYLELRDKAFDKGAIAILAKLPASTTIDLHYCSFVPADTKVLAQLSRCNVVRLSADGWAPDQRHVLKSLVPGLHWIYRDPSTGQIAEIE
ncbi:MAG: serine/threonine protein kinase [Cyanobacteria bacterium SZAS LIN-2]|nr:serine/threonine protein kinase [Cyanobacteria bacterium SZAS LIN-3]MBS1996359.1 serine/threonine protein kinase [Cyanobacteria bacterium SZAS LIN-2]